MEAGRGGPPREVVPLFVAAMGIFVLTVSVGILNGLDLIDFERATLVTHVHAGTLGWITLSVLAAVVWIFGRAGLPRLLRDGAIATIAVYVLAFWSGEPGLRPIPGGLVLVVTVWFFVWVVRAWRESEHTVPRLAMLAATTTLAIGAVFGLLLGLRLAGVLKFLPADALGAAHPTTMIVGYLILAGMAIDEWRLGGRGAGPSRSGTWQVWLLFTGGLVLTVGAMLDVQELIGLYIPLQVAGVTIFLLRMRRHIAATRWGDAEPRRQFALSAVFLALNVLLLAYLIVKYIVIEQIEDFTLIPSWLIFAFDHSMFIGVLSNAIFGLLFVATAHRRSVWPWAEHVAFWGVNLGMVGFVIGLMLQEPLLKRIFTPIMGASILVSMLAVALRLAAARGAARTAG